MMMKGRSGKKATEGGGQSCLPQHPRFFRPMTVTLNGLKREFPGTMPMSALLEALGLAGKPVVVEQNQVALLPRELVEAVVKEGDVVEVVQITAGG
jgi:sulfur carrier protein